MSQINGSMHGASCYYGNTPVLDGQWLKCTCVNKIPTGEIDKENARILKGKSPVADKFQEYKQNLRVNIDMILNQKDLSKIQMLDRIVAVVICTKDPRNS